MADYTPSFGRFSLGGCGGGYDASSQSGRAFVFPNRIRTAKIAPKFIFLKPIMKERDSGVNTAFSRWELRPISAASTHTYTMCGCVWNCKSWVFFAPTPHPKTKTKLHATNVTLKFRTDSSSIKRLVHRAQIFLRTAMRLMQSNWVLASIFSPFCLLLCKSKGQNLCHDLYSTQTSSLHLTLNEFTRKTFRLGGGG